MTESWIEGWSKGWFGESKRHELAAKGVKTAVKKKGKKGYKGNLIGFPKKPEEEGEVEEEETEEKKEEKTVLEGGSSTVSEEDKRIIAKEMKEAEKFKEEPKNITNRFKPKHLKEE